MTIPITNIIYIYGHQPITMKYFALLLFIITPFISFSQSNYHKSFVTDNNGQTKQGYINYREWDENPKFIEFKTSLDNKKPTVYTPSVIKSFDIEGFEQYTTYSGRISLNRTHFPDIATSKDTSSKQDNVFLKVVTTGSNLSLYAYTDSLKTRFYLQDKLEQPIELLYQLYYDDTKTQSISVKTYQGQLSYYVNKYAPANSKLQNYIERSNYDYSDIEYIVNQVNGKAKTKNASGASFIRLFAGAAVNVTQTRADGSSNYISRSQPSTSYAPKVDLGVDIFANPNVQKLILRFQVSYTNVKASLSADLPSTLSYSSETFKFDQYNFIASPQIIYNFYNTDSFKLYASGGIGFIFSDYTQADAFTLNGVPSTGVYYRLQKSWVNYSLQTGAVLNKRVELFLSFNPRAAYTQYDDFSISSSSFGAGVHFLMGKASKK